MNDEPEEPTIIRGGHDIINWLMLHPRRIARKDSDGSEMKQYRSRGLDSYVIETRTVNYVCSEVSAWEPAHADDEVFYPAYVFYPVTEEKEKREEKEEMMQADYYSGGGEIIDFLRKNPNVQVRCYNYLSGKRYRRRRGVGIESRDINADNSAPWKLIRGDSRLLSPHNKFVVAESVPMPAPETAPASTLSSEISLSHELIDAIDRAGWQANSEDVVRAILKQVRDEIFGVLRGEHNG